MTVSTLVLVVEPNLPPPFYPDRIRGRRTPQLPQTPPATRCPSVSLAPSTKLMMDNPQLDLSLMYRCTSLRSGSLSGTGSEYSRTPPILRWPPLPVTRGDPQVVQ